LLRALCSDPISMTDRGAADYFGSRPAYSIVHRNFRANRHSLSPDAETRRARWLAPRVRWPWA